MQNSAWRLDYNRNLLVSLDSLINSKVNSKDRVKSFNMIAEKQHKALTIIWSLGFVCSLVALLNISTLTYAQSSDPTLQKHFEFNEDLPKPRKALEVQEKSQLTSDKANKKVMDVKAPNLTFEKDQKTLDATGGMLLSGGGVEAQSDSGKINTETKDALLEGNVVFSGASADIHADKAAVNLEDETGQFQDASFLYDVSGYHLDSKELFKLSETRYRLIDSEMTTCECADGSCPWSIHADDTRITQNGYATSTNTTIWFHDVPIFYSPYFAFPAKVERTAGLLSPSPGWSRQNGFEYRQPLFVPLSQSADLKLTPFIETKTRVGSYIDYKKIFSDDNQLESRYLYSNEAWRDGSLRGLNTQGFIDSTIDKNRQGFYLNDIYRAPDNFALPIRGITDIHYISDGTMAKEFRDNEIVDPTAFVSTSTASVRSSFGDYFTGEISGEYNNLIYGQQQTFDDNNHLIAIGQDKLTFNRLPEVSTSFLKSFRPIDNPYGLRLVSKADLTQSYFERDVGYQGARTSFNPEETVPFHVSNYLNGSFGGGAYIRSYSLTDNLIPVPSGVKNGGLVEADPVTGAESFYDDSQTSSVPYFQSQIGTAFEKVYDVDKDSILANFASLGRDNQDNNLVRVKHVIEPTLSYLYIPDISQGDNPQFDSLDRITERSLVRYGVSTSLIGRYSPRKDVATGIPELAPELGDFPSFGSLQGIPDLGDTHSIGSITGTNSLRDGSVRQLLGLSVEQGYDFRKAYRRDQEISNSTTDTSTIEPLTDLTTSLSGSPTQNLNFRIDNYYNTKESRISGWSISSQLSTDRGDKLYGRYSFVGPPQGFPDGNTSLDQIDGGAEAVITDRTRVGFYTRYDILKSDVLYNRVALRFYSACNCWHFDVGYADTLNPANQTYYINLTLTGLGGATQNLYSMNNVQ